LENLISATYFGVMVVEFCLNLTPLVLKFLLLTYKTTLEAVILLSCINFPYSFPISRYKIMEPLTPTLFNTFFQVNLSYQSGVIFSIIDPQMGSYPSEHVEKFLTLALKCCNDEPDNRPKMAEVVRELENIWNVMPESDTRRAESINSVSDSSKAMSTPSSSSAIRTPFVSGDVSGSDLVSGVIPSIKPR
jgi:hypothetical protein